MRPIRETVPLGEALALLFEHARPIDRVERIPIAEAMDRVLAEDIASAVDVPPFDRAAMDGYAVVADDTFGAGRYEPKVLHCIETVYTGDVPSRTLTHGDCVEIATGAPMPHGATAVVMVEETEKTGDAVKIFAPVYPGQHVGRRGADMKAGQTILRAGAVINPSRIGALAAAGVLDIHVFAKPRVAIVSTGNEIVDPGQPLKPGQIYDINKLTLSSITNAHGGVAINRGTAPDTLPDLIAAIESMRDADLIVFSGGSSVGERDLILDALRQAGEVIFHGIAVKPGKPTAFGMIGATPVLGMPGYPTSCLSNGYILLVPFLRRIARLPDHQPHIVRVPLSVRVVSTTGRHQFYTVRIQDGTAVPAFKASGDITS
ncbi:MAG TPA: gephyrin-like molybdotransferase Glp, partial [Vicinamibacterales bacterium]|nr:gephyrin-like molybdotransferase Glp [Vicinamibacterales bacterium]